RRAPNDSGRPIGGPSDEASSTLGLPLLNQVALPVGTRELRIGSWYSMIARSPETVIRLIDQPGRPPTGEVAVVWQDTHAWPQQRPGDRCTKWKNDHRSCAVVVPTDIDWPQAAARLAELGAWTITERCDEESYI